MKTIIPLSILRAPYILTRRRIFRLVIVFNFLLPFNTHSQCTTYTVNWDYLDFFHNQATWYNTNNPATGQPFVTNAMKQSQNFALGPGNVLNIATSMAVGSASGLYGDLTNHGGDVAGYAGADVAFVPTAGQIITFTFLNEVSSASFTLYDVDRSQAITVASANTGGTGQPVTATTYSGSILTISGTTSKTASASNTASASPSNSGTVTFSISGQIKTITLTVGTLGTDASFWLSKILACVAGAGFTTNYYQPYTEPYTGQPAYFLANPDTNLNVYMVDPVNATAHVIFTDPGTALGSAPAGIALNSLAYDPVNHWLYYVMNGATSTSKPGNRSLKKYDFTTGTISTVINDVNSLGIPTFLQGVEAAAAAFYDGSLYLGIEGTDAISFLTNTESVIWRIDFDGSGAAIRASQVFGLPSDNGGGQPSHDWGDFITKDGTIITHASNQLFPSYQSAFVHYNMTTATGTTYGAYADTAGQIGQLYNGTIYRLDTRVAIYNGNGTTGTPSTVTLTSCSPSWNNRTMNDISCPFRPAQDFGDAPATYDPVALSPAANQKACNNTTLRLGSAWGDEWNKNTSSDASGDDEEDGINTVGILVSNGTTYNHAQEVIVLNNTGSPAYLAAWLDYNANGIFEASEGVVTTVPSNASPQTITLGWNNITVAFGTPNTFLRVRLYSGSLSTSSATGWLADGETEDYMVISQSEPLVIELLNFSANLTHNKEVLLNWRASADNESKGFEVQRSKDQLHWEKIGWVNIKTSATTADYSLIDQQPLEGKSYYRLKMVERSGSSKFSNNRLIQLDQLLTKLKIYPNPAKNDITVSINSTINKTATLKVTSLSGSVMIKKIVVLTQGENRIQVATDKLINGSYIVELITPERTFVSKLTVTH